MRKNSFGSIVKNYRQKQGLTQLDIVVKSNGAIRPSTISKAETEPGYDPSLSKFIDYYKIMGISFEEWLELLDGTPNYDDSNQNAGENNGQNK
ncbi:helix-turn-helix domain-containing protein [Leuconostoc gasicomitatum]|uniref:helix-turn-helix domain-containing protein n=1 Tax=Leuconostoc gasicomitatum TaxID=115778 RepID=UPI0007E1B93A|nr:helix-turn-helix transcriptional regulator [Leuconostoc gasicomitatum]CUW05978.1 Transcriptional regulator, xre family [Leuconostoc gasicomitatum]